MRFVLLLLTAWVVTPSASAQAPPDSTDRVRRVEAPDRPPLALSVQILAGTLGAAGGAYGGYYVGDAIEPDGFIISSGGFAGVLIGSTVGAAFAVTAVGDRDGFLRTLAGAAVGTIAGFTAASVVANTGLEDAGLLLLPLGSAAGAAIANSALGDR